MCFTDLQQLSADNLRLPLMIVDVPRFHPFVGHKSP